MSHRFIKKRGRILLPIVALITSIGCMQNNGSYSISSMSGTDDKVNSNSYNTYHGNSHYPNNNQGNQAGGTASSPPSSTSGTSTVGSFTTDSGKICYTQSLNQPNSCQYSKLDILLIPDTSGSLNEERQNIASEIGAFVNEIPTEVDYQIAIMPAHGSRGSHSGKLWKYRHEPYVLKSSEKSVSSIIKSLKRSLSNMAGDYFADGGEEGLYSLNRALTSHGLLTAIQAKGFFRKDAALAVIFIADENDICYNYPDGLKRAPDPDRLEDAAYKRDCQGITPESVYSRLKDFMGKRPLTVNGVIYTKPELVPKGPENEVGYGYIDIIRLNQGIAIEMSQKNFHEGMKDIGVLAAKRLNLISEIKMEHTSNIDPLSIAVRIDQRFVDAAIQDGFIKLLGELGSPGSLIEVTYCENTPTPDPTPSPTPTPDPTPSPTPTPDPTPSPTPTPDPTPSPTPTPDPTPSPTPTPDPTPSPTPTLPPGAVDENHDGVDDITGEPIF